jgi:hypothetical protein
LKENYETQKDKTDDDLTRRERMEKVSLNQLHQRGYKVKYLDDPVRCECGFYGLAGQLVVDEDEINDDDAELRCPECEEKTWVFD